MVGLIIGIISLVLIILPLVFWILKVIRLSKNEDKTGMWVDLACGIFLTPLIGWLVGLAYKEDDKDDTDKTKKGGDFWCGICNIKYQEDLLGGETIYEGKICRSCLGKIKVQALNNPRMGLATEIPFGRVIKDFFKMLTSEVYSYGGHSILISLTWKIGIILVFLLPLVIWIYNLVSFISTKGEIKRLETEIQELKRMEKDSK